MAVGEIVLVVDDNQAVRRFIEGTLRPLGYKVETAGDGIEALQRVARGPVDLILLDFVMPRMNGYHFCKALDEKGLAQDVPVILLSSAEERIAERMREMTRVVDFLPKPVKAGVLRETVRRHLPQVDTGEEDDLDAAFGDGMGGEQDFGKFDLETSDDGIVSPIELLDTLRDKIQGAVADGFAARLDEILAAADKEEMLGFIGEAVASVVDDELLEKLVALVRSSSQ